MFVFSLPRARNGLDISTAAIYMAVFLVIIGKDFTDC